MIFLMALITKKELEHLAELARLELDGRSEEKLAHDLEAILKHFEELKEVNTEGVTPMTGGTFLKNVWRNDEVLKDRLQGSSSTAAFPETKDGFLKVPGVFGA